MNRALIVFLVLVVGAIAAFLFFKPAPKTSNTESHAATTKETTSPTPSTITPAPSTSTKASATNETTPVYTYKIINTYSHDPNAFTQGLLYDHGIMYEGTGLYGESTLREVEFETGKVLRQKKLAGQYFGEGVALWKNELIQLTWQNQLGFVYDKESFQQLKTFNYLTEGWGITHDDKRLIMSDGSPNLYFLDPDTLKEIGRVEVRDQGRPVKNLNELEYINGEVYANIWLTNQIARINPETGQVVGWIDLSGLLRSEDITRDTDVLNGIAYDAEHDRLFVTGKKWPKLFEIKLIPKQ
ncbi:glutaminyl-peptide cyclotransferase [Candidatus Acetothermia bacterium]|nr:glutaminyl-peptide cyclotransferase [Candidatus Acetothermia bacterium]MBI3461409.1 glutaminyl-peptide cyclotransferase [Candidatus Acetothermia bacterium]MBI3660383.1 glutaminyl-peptide cyclotransferase [Candidatus Acetothermia bacterium]